MKRKKLVFGILSVLILLTAALAFLYDQMQDRVPEGAIAVSFQGRNTYTDWHKLNLTEISGTIVNGKGEEKVVNGQGVALFSLAPGDVQSATAVSKDGYSAVVGMEDAENAFLLLCEDGSARLVVFGDDNAKRDVKQVMKVEFR